MDHFRMYIGKAGSAMNHEMYFYLSKSRSECKFPVYDFRISTEKKRKKEYG
jgi:hypothetical protein